MKLCLPFESCRTKPRRWERTLEGTELCDWRLRIIWSPRTDTQVTSLMSCPAFLACSRLRLPSVSHPTPFIHARSALYCSCKRSVTKLLTDTHRDMTVLRGKSGKPRKLLPIILSRSFFGGQSHWAPIVIELGFYLSVETLWMTKNSVSYCLTNISNMFLLGSCFHYILTFTRALSPVPS